VSALHDSGHRILFPEWDVDCIFLCKRASSGLGCKLVDSGAAGSRDFGAGLGSRFRFYRDSVSPQSYERELRRSLNGCAFVVMQTVMQTEDQKCDSEVGEQSAQEFKTQRFDIQAIGLDGQHRRGSVAEAAFLAKASSLGFGVAKPWGDERYDFIVDSGHCFWRVQVKSTRVHLWGEYTVRVASNNLAPYDETQIDFVAAYLVPENAWYVIPVELLKRRRSLCFYPRGRGKSQWEKYREGWCQMACPYDEYGPSKIVTPRCRDNGRCRWRFVP